jgi:hypothetical protein
MKNSQGKEYGFQSPKRKKHPLERISAGRNRWVESNPHVTFYQ